MGVSLLPMSRNGSVSAALRGRRGEGGGDKASGAWFYSSDGSTPDRPLPSPLPPSTGSRRGQRQKQKLPVSAPACLTEQWRTGGRASEMQSYGVCVSAREMQRPGSRISYLSCSPIIKSTSRLHLTRTFPSPSLTLPPPPSPTLWPLSDLTVDGKK